MLGMHYRFLGDAIRGVVAIGFDDGGKQIVALEDIGRANLAQMNMYASDDYQKMKANPDAFAKETSARITAREILRNAVVFRQIGDIASAEREEVGVTQTGQSLHTTVTLDMANWR